MNVHQLLEQLSELVGKGHGNDEVFVYDPDDGPCPVVEITGRCNGSFILEHEAPAYEPRTPSGPVDPLTKAILDIDPPTFISHLVFPPGGKPENDITIQIHDPNKTND